jgi:Holliday junction DNA helicase RuvA
MIAYLHGTLTDKSPTQVSLEVGGIGYEVQITLNTYEALKELTTCKIFTYLHITQDAYTLYGFANIIEKQWFLQLLGVNGIGPRTAMTVLSYLKPDQLQQIIFNQQVEALQSIKGLGQKSAQRIILELAGKAAKVDTVVATAFPQQGAMYQEALAALTKLGIPKAVAEKNLATALKHYQGERTVEALIRLALKG